MPVQQLPYSLHDGYIHNWLVAGPLAVEVQNLERFQGDDFKLQIARHYYTPDSGITEPPLESARFSAGGKEFSWEYASCRDDHYVDLTAFYHICHYLRAWAFARVRVPAAGSVTVALTTNGPADVWLNGRHVHRQEHMYLQIPQTLRFQTDLQQGDNDILVRFENVATRACPFDMALQLLGDGEPLDATVNLPTTITAIEQRLAAERAVEAAYLDRDVFALGEDIALRWPEVVGPASLAISLRSSSGDVLTTAACASPGCREVVLARSSDLPEGAYEVVVTPADGAAMGARIERKIALTVIRNTYSQTSYGTFEQRRVEALADAARYTGSMFGQIANMALGRWDMVNGSVFTDVLEGINQRKDCSDFWLCGLLGMRARFVNDPHFPEALKHPLEDCIINFKYWIDEPGGDAMCYWTENHQILFHACEIMAGQTYPERVFSNTGQTGQWHRRKGEQLALAWMKKRAAGGFREWDSNCYFEEDLLALSHLVDLAESPAIRDGAAAIMHKMFYTMAVNSYRGVFGSTHGRTYAPLIKGARLESTSGIGRLMWGQGAFNHRILATVSLACAGRYHLPDVIARIAADLPEAMWEREHYKGVLHMPQDSNTGPWDVNKVTYKTPDYMLSSAQDWFPGRRGFQQHIWQATLGPDAVVFVSQPPCVSQEGSHRPNYWHGNVTLPRVAQWRDTLCAIYNLPADDWLGFSHAYFPLYAFDEHLLRDGWAFGRKDEGYIALTAACGLELISSGDSAYRELRSHGRQNVWLCLMGRAALDGSFGEFQARVLALQPRVDSLSVQTRTLRGDDLAFGWQGPLLVNGKEQPITGFRHYDGQYSLCDFDSPLMEIRHGNDVLKVEFE